MQNKRNWLFELCGRKKKEFSEITIIGVDLKNEFSPIVN